MTKEQLEGFALALKGLSYEGLSALKDDVDKQLEDFYWCDENFHNRERTDSYIYIIVYKDLSCYYDCIGKRSYERYLKDDNAIRLECKTKHLFPDYKVLMSKGDL